MPHCGAHSSSGAKAICSGSDLKKYIIIIIIITITIIINTRYSASTIIFTVDIINYVN